MHEVVGDFPNLDAHGKRMYWLVYYQSPCGFAEIAGLLSCAYVSHWGETGGNKVLRNNNGSPKSVIDTSISCDEHPA